MNQLLFLKFLAPMVFFSMALIVIGLLGFALKYNQGTILMGKSDKPKRRFFVYSFLFLGLALVLSILSMFMTQKIEESKNAPRGKQDSPPNSPTQSATRER